MQNVVLQLTPPASKSYRSPEEFPVAQHLRVNKVGYRKTETGLDLVANETRYLV